LCDRSRSISIWISNTNHNLKEFYMADLSLDIARKILDAALAKVIEKKLKPMAITVLDARGCVKASLAQDGTSLMRGEIAYGKAYGALSLGIG
jgi:uncharacterized protein GlcG (DUF336 family)